MITRACVFLPLLLALTACARSGASPPTATFTARDYGFSGPATIRAGVTRFQLVNQGQHAHMLGLVALSDGKTAADLLAAVKAAPSDRFPPYATWVGGPDAVDPGRTSIASVDLPAGSYAIVCTMPDGDTGHSHLERGMIQGLSVTGSAQHAKLPTPAASVTESEFHFSTAGTIHSGVQTIQVRNDGQQEHEAQLARLPDGVSLDQYVALNDATSATTGSSYGGLATIAPSTSGTFTSDFQPGHYVFICFATDPQSGKAHFELGMTSEFTVK